MALVIGQGPLATQVPLTLMTSLAGQIYDPLFRWFWCRMLINVCNSFLEDLKKKLIKK